VESEHAPRANAPPIVVPELRDYHQINAELVRRLNLGERHVRLEGVAGQRLLVSQIAGAWQAVIEVHGDAGPELAAELDAPGLTVVCRGSTADGAGRGLTAGRLLIGQAAGAAIGYFQRGGMIVAVGNVGPRAGLHQQGGDLVLLDRVGALAGERQSGGRLVFKQGCIGPHSGHGRQAGRLIVMPAKQFLPPDLDPEDRDLIEAALGLVNCFFSPT
jgi:methylamine---glutamate N-methyltransferase subunit B